MTNGEILKAFPWVWEWNKDAFLITYVENNPRIISRRAKRQWIKIRAIRIWREEIKPALFPDDMILHVENTKNVYRELLELTRELRKIAGYKINIK